MENASKALLIAGAILIAILLIAIGMMVFNSASGVIDTASSGMTDNEKTMHNKKFTIYEGTQSGATVKKLLQDVVVHNSNSDNVPIVTIAYYAKGATSATAGRINKSVEDVRKWIQDNSGTYIINSKMYKVECFDNKSSTNTTMDGIVEYIKITEL